MKPGTNMEMAVAAPWVDLDELFSRLFEDHHGYVLHSLRRLGVAERELEDLTHDVFVVAHRKLGDFDATRPARPWLFAICVRVSADHRKRARTRYERVTAEPEATDPMPRADAMLERKQQQGLVIKALDALDHDRRALFVMVEIDEVPVVEAALALGVPLNTAYSRLRLARADFAAAVARMRAGGVR